MNKINTKSIVLSLVMLAILTFGVIMTPKETNAQSQYGGYISSINTIENNPKPVIKSITPSSSNIGAGTKTVTITGSGFVVNSIIRLNGSNRPTTFIDSSHLLVQITGNDTYSYLSNGGFFITVFNGAPGGGYSNAAFFTVNNPSVTATTNKNTQNNNTTNNNSTNFTDAPKTDNGNNNYSDLASNAIFGSNGIYPSGLIQWIFFAILVLLIVILVRRIYGANKKYQTSPMKHD